METILASLAISSPKGSKPVSKVVPARPSTVLKVLMPPSEIEALVNTYLKTGKVSCPSAVPLGQDSFYVGLLNFITTVSLSAQPTALKPLSGQYFPVDYSAFPKPDSSVETNYVQTLLTALNVPGISIGKTQDIVQSGNDAVTATAGPHTSMSLAVARPIVPTTTRKGYVPPPWRVSVKRREIRLSSPSDNDPVPVNPGQSILLGEETKIGNSVSISIPVDESLKVPAGDVSLKTFEEMYVAMPSNADLYARAGFVATSVPIDYLSGSFAKDAKLTDWVDDVSSMVTTGLGLIFSFF